MISAGNHAVPRAVSRKTMKKVNSRGQRAGQVPAGEMLPEYDFSRARSNKYASRCAAGSTVVVLEPDVAAVSQTAGVANEALRALAGVIQRHRPPRTLPRRNP